MGLPATPRVGAALTLLVASVALPFVGYRTYPATLPVAFFSILILATLWYRSGRESETNAT